MPIPVTCEYCEVSYRITDKAAGKRVRCKDCGEPLDVPEAANRTPARPRRSDRSENRSRQERRPRRDRSEQSEPETLIANRRERKYDDSGSNNLAIGIACGAIALLGGLGFLFFGRADSDAGQDRPTIPGVPANREELNAQLADARQRSEALRDQIVREGRGISQNANPDNWQSPTRPPEFGINPGMGGPPPGFNPPPNMQPGGNAGNTNVDQNAPEDRGANNSVAGAPGQRFRPPNFGAGRPDFGGRARFSSLPDSAETDQELTKLEEAFLNGDTGSRSRAIITLSRSSRQERAAEILSKGLGQFDESRIIGSIGGLGAGGEKAILKIIADKPGESRLRDCMFALMRCGTEEALPTLAKLKSSTNRSVASMARSAEMRITIQKRTGR